MFPTCWHCRHVKHERQLALHALAQEHTLLLFRPYRAPRSRQGHDSFPNIRPHEACGCKRFITVRSDSATSRKKRDAYSSSCFPPSDTFSPPPVLANAPACATLQRHAHEPMCTVTCQCTRTCGITSLRVRCISVIEEAN